MNSVTFDRLVTNYGEVAAWHYLAEIERAAGIRPNHASYIDANQRLTVALQRQDEMGSAIKLAA